MDKLKVVSIGGFGHSVFVFNDMVGMTEAELVAVAPVLDDEPLDIITGHEIFNGRIRHYDDSNMPPHWGLGLRQQR